MSGDQRGPRTRGSFRFTSPAARNRGREGGERDKGGKGTSGAHAVRGVHARRGGGVPPASPEDPSAAGSVHGFSLAVSNGMASTASPGPEDTGDRASASTSTGHASRASRLSRISVDSVGRRPGIRAQGETPGVSEATSSSKGGHRRLAGHQKKKARGRSPSPPSFPSFTGSSGAPQGEFHATARLFDHQDDRMTDRSVSLRDSLQDFRIFSDGEDEQELDWE